MNEITYLTYINTKKILFHLMDRPVLQGDIHMELRDT